MLIKDVSVDHIIKERFQFTRQSTKMLNNPVTVTLTTT